MCKTSMMDRLENLHRVSLEREQVIRVVLGQPNLVNRAVYTRRVLKT